MVFNKFWETKASTHQLQEMRKAMSMFTDEETRLEAAITNMRRQGQLDLMMLEPGDLVGINCDHGIVWFATLYSTRPHENDSTIVRDTMAKVFSSRDLVEPSSGYGVGIGPFERSWPRFFKCGEEFFNMGTIRQINLNGTTLL